MTDVIMHATVPAVSSTTPDMQRVLSSYKTSTSLLAKAAGVSMNKLEEFLSLTPGWLAEWESKNGGLQWCKVFSFNKCQNGFQYRKTGLHVMNDPSKWTNVLKVGAQYPGLYITTVQYAYKYFKFGPCFQLVRIPVERGEDCKILHIEPTKSRASMIELEGPEYSLLDRSVYDKFGWDFWKNAHLATYAVQMGDVALLDELLRREQSMTDLERLTRTIPSTFESSNELVSAAAAAKQESTLLWLVQHADVLAQMGCALRVRFGGLSLSGISVNVWRQVFEVLPVPLGDLSHMFTRCINRAASVAASISQDDAIDALRVLNELFPGQLSYTSKALSYVSSELICQFLCDHILTVHPTFTRQLHMTWLQREVISLLHRSLRFPSANDVPLFHFLVERLKRNQTPEFTEDSVWTAITADIVTAGGSLGSTSETIVEALFQCCPPDHAILLLPAIETRSTGTIMQPLFDRWRVQLNMNVSPRHSLVDGLKELRHADFSAAKLTSIKQRVVKLRELQQLVLDDAVCTELRRCFYKLLKTSPSENKAKNENVLNTLKWILSTEPVVSETEKNSQLCLSDSQLTMLINDGFDSNEIVSSVNDGPALSFLRSHTLHSVTLERLVVLLVMFETHPAVRMTGLDQVEVNGKSLFWNRQKKSKSSSKTKDAKDVIQYLDSMHRLTLLHGLQMSMDSADGVFSTFAQSPRVQRRWVDIYSPHWPCKFEWLHSTVQQDPCGYSYADRDGDSDEYRTHHKELYEAFRSCDELGVLTHWRENMHVLDIDLPRKIRVQTLFEVVIGNKRVRDWTDERYELVLKKQFRKTTSRKELVDIDYNLQSDEYESEDDSDNDNEDDEDIEGLE